MTTPRSDQLRQDAPQVFHVVSRVVRRCFLCGDGYEHRKTWIANRLREISGIFSAEVLTYAVMSNHLHVVVRMDPLAVSGWSDGEVARRWLTLFPTETANDGSPLPPSDSEIALLVMQSARIATLRERLGSLSWFMKCLKEPISRMANQEDEVTGAFWEGRFKSVVVLDHAALLAAMTYVDLNPVRAKVAETPEASLHTGVKDRIEGRQAFAKAQRLRQEAGTEDVARKTLQENGLSNIQHEESGLWVAPIRSAVMESTDKPLSAEEYIDLVDVTGRLLKSGKRGAIPPHLAAILTRLDMDVETWLASVLGMGSGLGLLLGRAASLIAEGARRGLKKIRCACQALRGETVKAPQTAEEYAF